MCRSCAAPGDVPPVVPSDANDDFVDNTLLILPTPPAPAAAAAAAAAELPPPRSISPLALDSDWDPPIEQPSGVAAAIDLTDSAPPSPQLDPEAGAVVAESEAPMANLKLEHSMLDTQKLYDSFEELHQAVKVYAEATGMTITIRDTHTRQDPSNPDNPKARVALNGKMVCRLTGRKQDESNEVPRSKHHIAVTGCGWFVNYAWRMATQKYHINNHSLLHNHALEAVLPSWQPRDILVQSQLTSSMINRVDALLMLKVDRATITATLISEHKLGRIDPMAMKNILSSRRRKLGLTDGGEQIKSLIDWMKQQRDEQAAAFDVSVDEDLRADGIFYMASESIAAFQRNGQVLVLDATCKTNRYGMQLVVLIGVSEHFRSEMYAFCLIKRESIDMYLWCMTNIRRVVGEEAWQRVRTIVTDGDPAFYSVIEQLLPHITHLRCRWHIQQNIQKRLAACLNRGTSENMLLRFMEDFKKIQHTTTVEQFETSWKTLLFKFRKRLANDDYLQKWVYPLRHQWCSAWCDHHLNFGVHVTSRVEGVNALIKRHVGQGTTLINLFKTLQTLVTQQSLSNLIDKPIPSAPGGSRAAFLEERMQQLTQWSASFVNTQYTYAHQFIARQLGSSRQDLVALNTRPDEVQDPSHTVKITPEHMHCSCLLPSMYGLPCRHVLIANYKISSHHFVLGQIHPRWRLDYRPLAGRAVGLSHFAAASASNIPTVRAPLLANPTVMFNNLTASARLVCSLAARLPMVYPTIMDWFSILEKQLTKHKSSNPSELRISKEGIAERDAAALGEEVLIERTQSGIALSTVDEPSQAIRTGRFNDSRNGSSAHDMQHHKHRENVGGTPFSLSQLPSPPSF